MELILCEFRKNFQRRSLLLVILALSIINAVKIGTDYKLNAYYGSPSRETQNEKHAYETLYSKQYKGEITDEKIAEIMDYINSHYTDAVQLNYDKAEDFDKYISGTWFGDYHAYYFKLYLPYKYFYGYKGYSDKIVAKAVDNIAFYKGYGNDYEVIRNYKIAYRYSDREITEFYDTEGAEVYLNYDFSSLLVLLILVYALTPVFLGERQNGMHPIIAISRYGTERTAMAKILSSIVFSAAVTIWFAALTLFQHAMIYSTDGMNLPLYAIRQFQQTPLSMEIWQFILLDFAMRCLGVIFFTGVILLISALCKSWLTAFGAEIGFIGILVVIYDFFPRGNFINPVSLLTCRELFTEFNTLKLFNAAVEEYVVTIASATVVTATVIFMTVFVYIRSCGTPRGFGKGKMNICGRN